MKKINGLIFIVISVFLALMFLINFFVNQSGIWDGGREYRISINRIRQAVVDYEKENGNYPKNIDVLKEYSKTDFPLITKIIAINSSDTESLSDLLDNGDSDYVVITTDNYFYKVMYKTGDSGKNAMLFFVNGVGILFFILLLSVLFYVRNKILLPFYKLSDVPYELSKGNLVLPIQENKNRFFGRFVWGMDLLRERLEENKFRELELQREKKMLLLSLFHDIKTPLSAIKLYAKALSKNLYREEKKKQDITENISKKVDEIEGYISEMVRASNEDFLYFDVSNGEIYLGDVVEKIREYYAEKMQLNQITFEIGEYQNCLVFGDVGRLVEVLQNIIENAIKYGDGEKIWVLFERDEEEVVICIYNTGSHIETKELNHIFDSFFRGSNVGKRTGSGLGLYICRQLLHLMEGGISARVLDGDIMEVRVAVRLV